MGRMAALGGTLTLASDGVYLFLIRRRGFPDGTLRTPIVACFLAACGLLALGGASAAGPRIRLGLVSFSAAGALTLGA